jgi:hypothetical protein
VLIEHGLGHARRHGDIVHRRPVEARVGEHHEGDIEDLLAASGGGKSG